MRGSELGIKRNGLSIFCNGFRIFLQAGVGETQLKMWHRFSWFGRGNLLEQGNGSGKIVVI